MRTRLVQALLVVLLAVAGTGAARAGDSWVGSVRPLAKETADLLEEGLLRSALLRSQVEVLDASDVVVYLTEAFESEAGEPKGKLQFLSATAGKRYLVVSLRRWKLAPSQRLVVLAHELQHAVEVAAAPGVTDLASFRALYSRIGWEVKAGHFETDAARQATRRMKLELHLSPASDSRRSTG